MVLTSSQLCDHFRGIPIGVHRLNLTVRVNLQNVDPFELHLAAALARSLADPLHGSAVAGDKHCFFRQSHTFEILADGGKEFAQACAAVGGGTTDR